MTDEQQSVEIAAQPLELSTDSSPESVSAEEAPLSRRELLMQRAQAPLRTEEYMDCVFTALNGKSYGVLKQLESDGLSAYKGAKRTQMLPLVQQAALLAVCVVDPQISFDEWLFMVEDADHAFTDALVDKAREVANIETDQSALAKKLLREMQSDSRS